MYLIALMTDVYKRQHQHGHHLIAGPAEAQQDVPQKAAARAVDERLQMKFARKAAQRGEDRRRAAVFQQALLHGHEPVGMRFVGAGQDAATGAGCNGGLHLVAIVQRCGHAPNGIWPAKTAHARCV